MGGTLASEIRVDEGGENGLTGRRRGAEIESRMFS